jgi:cellulose synthase/poly-beta-1,6-N-acetylglucosamine synthase-like glycosyltransferase
MSVLEVDLSFLFVVAVILIWFMIAYQFALTIFGYINYLKSFRERKSVDATQYNYPTCTIMIPAHNEAMVIGRTVESMLKLEYPKDKLTILVINDGSKDETASIVQKFADQDSRVVLFNVPLAISGRAADHQPATGGCNREIQDSEQRRDTAHAVHQHRDAELPIHSASRTVADAQHRDTPRHQLRCLDSLNARFGRMG